MLLTFQINIYLKKIILSKVLIYGHIFWQPFPSFCALSSLFLNTSFNIVCLLGLFWHFTLLPFAYILFLCLHILFFFPLPLEWRPFPGCGPSAFSRSPVILPGSFLLHGFPFDVSALKLLPLFLIPYVPVPVYHQCPFNITMLSISLS